MMLLIFPSTIYIVLSMWMFTLVEHPMRWLLSFLINIFSFQRTT